MKRHHLASLAKGKQKIRATLIELINLVDRVNGESDVLEVLQKNSSTYRGERNSGHEAIKKRASELYLDLQG